MSTIPKVTATMLYNLVQCEHRPWMDLYADPNLRDNASPFVELLWRRGRAHEDTIIQNYKGPLCNLRSASISDREALTRQAMASNEPLIYGARISNDDLLGEPDLLRLEDGKYVPGDIKSGSGDEAADDDDRKPKKHYGVQLALYADILERLGFSAGRRGFIWDVHGAEVRYDLESARGLRNPESLWDTYQKTLAAAREIAAGVRNPGAAYSAVCKHCQWFSACMNHLEQHDDLTLLPGLGRYKRDAFAQHVASVHELAQSTPERFINEKGKSILKGLGVDSIEKFRARAVLRSSGGSAYITSPIELSSQPVEIFFDIETDPMRDHCYLHGFVERRAMDSSGERFFGFFSTTADAKGEREAFAAAYEYLTSQQPCAIYIYSKYERTWWRKLRDRYPNVCTVDEIERLFSAENVVDLLQIVQSSTEWPTRDFSIKSLASYLGFKWRDPHPSGAASIEWYDRYINGDGQAKQRILDYNEDDCRAMRVLLDGIRQLPSANTI